MSSPGERTFAGMSLNRSEELLRTYLEANPEERQHWREKVRRQARDFSDPHAWATRLEADLWLYFRERAECRPGEFQVPAGQKPARVSLRNLAELLIRLWGVPPTPAAPPESRR